MTVKEKAQNLAKAILNSKEYEELQESEAEVTSNEEAYEILKQFETQRQKIYRVQRQGRSVSKEAENKLRTLQQKMEQNERLQNLMKAQEKFNGLMENIYQLINREVYGENGHCHDNCGGGCC